MGLSWACWSTWLPLPGAAMKMLIAALVLTTAGREKGVGAGEVWGQGGGC